MHFLQNLISALRPPAPDENTELDAIVKTGFQNPRTVDPDTKHQWVRLRTRLAEERIVHERESNMPVPRLAIGMGVLVVAAISLYTYISFDQPTVQSYTTGRGEQQEILLQDGSVVILNYGSELSVPERLPDGTRHVSLTGEAFFTVAHDESRFIVTTSSGQAEVVGTEFNLNTRSGGLDVAVVSGTVNVGASRDGRDSVIRVTKHQRATCPADGFPRRIADIPSSEFPGWLHGKIYLSGTTFDEARREIENRFDVTVLTEDQALLSREITGVLEARTPGSAVAALCVLSGKTYTHHGKDYVIR